jgi:diaminopimelate epimerase
MKFSKLQATGNDFILVDGRDMERDWAKLARAMCQRHFGVGADGLLVVKKSNVADLKMRVFNPDGSEAEVCGNGLRCFVKYAIEGGIVDKVALQDETLSKTKGQQNNPCLTIKTLAGTKKAKAYMVDKVAWVEVNMGMPRFEPEQIPTKEEVDIMPILNYPLTLGKRKLSLSLLSMGNPHAVYFGFEPVVEFPLAEVGPQVERHYMFPQGMNFEIAKILDKSRIEARVWERGVGETLACGSGACAIAVAARLLNYVDSKIDIIFPGGTLAVTWDGEGEVVLGGPVEEVFTGEWLR